MSSIRWPRRGEWVLVIVLVVWFVVFRPVALGGAATMIVIRGDSMAPTYTDGDLVLLRAEATYGSGDIVAYRVADGEIGEGHVVIHRITADGGADGFVLQGDGNDAPDPWHPSADHILGRAWLSIPGLGAALAWVAQPLFAASLASAVVVAVLVVREPGRGNEPVPRGGQGSSTAARRRALVLGVRARRRRPPGSLLRP